MGNKVHIVLKHYATLLQIGLQHKYASIVFLDSNMQPYDSFFFHET